MNIQSLRVFLLLALVMASSAFAETRPNVVIFLADDAGWGDYSRNGNTQVSTPHIDSIARDGVTLDRFYVCPVCAPTRAEFLTGRYHPRTGVYGVSTGQERMSLDERTIADAFKTAGYATGAFGKWHNGSQWPYHPMARGFDEYYGYTSGHWGEYFDPPLEHNGKPVRAKGYIVDACTDQALDFIERNHKSPFLCYVPFTTPHSPWAVPEQNWNLFKNKPIDQRGSQPDQEDIDQTRCALAMIENQDGNVGRVLKALDDHGIAENTIVLYFSDNGPNSWRWNGGMKGRKGTTDEAAVLRDQLTAEVATWREEVNVASLANKPRKTEKSNGVDPRPIPVGYREFPRTWLPARDGEPNGSVQRSSSAPNCSYFVNWRTVDDRLTWEIDLHTTGNYEVEILYTCPEADAGSTIELSFQEHKLSGKVTPGWDPPLYRNQDTIPRPPAESQMKEFRPLRLGVMHLTEGRGELSIRATAVPRKSVMDLRAMTLTLVESRAE